MLLPIMRERLFTALSGTADVLDRLLDVLEPNDPGWDIRPDPERFTLREVMAHLADYEIVWRERLRQTREEDRPDLFPADRDQLAIDHDYAHSDVSQSRALFRQRREDLVHSLRGISQEDWQRIGTFPGPNGGPLTLEEQAAFIVIHDGYHLPQVAQWVQGAVHARHLL